jgi:hypothetical protein
MKSEDSLSLFPPPPHPPHKEFGQPRQCNKILDLKKAVCGGTCLLFQLRRWKQ